MIHGIDTGFLVAAELIEHPDHQAARDTLARLVARGDRFAIAPQVLDEFIHVASDARRFSRSLNVEAARYLAEQWWTARDVEQVFPNKDAVQQFFAWLSQFHLGRKRLPDTMLAATYLHANVSSLLTSNPSDFAVFVKFQCITPSQSTADHEAE